jgi:bacterioferritin
MAKAPKELIDALNEDLSYELSAIVQYMYHHIMAAGFDSPEIDERFKATSMDEMKHAEKVAERIDYYGAVPTTKIGPIQVGGDVKQMIENDLASEHDAIARYKDHIKLAERVDDPGTRHMLEDILLDEEDHAYQWETILERA